MVLTSFRLKRIENPTNRLIAKCTITFDNMFAVSDIKILTKEDSDYYMGMPSKKTSLGTFKDEAYPVNSQTRAALENILFAATKYCEDNDIQSISAVNESDKTSMLEQDFDDFSIETL